MYKSEQSLRKDCFSLPDNWRAQCWVIQCWSWCL